MPKDEGSGAGRGYHHGDLKEALFRAALELIAKKGPAGFTFAEAARWVGVSPAAPYRHFRDRDELLAKVALRGFNLFEESLARAWNAGRPSPDEREARESFYQNMIWVVDGRRRLHDWKRFCASFGAALVVKAKPLTFLFPSIDNPLLRDWTDSRVPVFFDFGDLDESDELLRCGRPVMWRLNPQSAKRGALLTPVSKMMFLHAYREGQPLKGFDYSEVIKRMRPQLPRVFMRPRRAKGFREYLARPQEAQKRARF